ncbi:MFS transporter [Halalkalibacter krulwichiae]|uniref:2-acyl-glycerophospho-ethanolamine acyltransferase n=1 Tax=Halalkalibacter krulwichiae TaxID=199441 RepID=A0A1X9M8V6_9BACI|nr:MFS transporter [Halalkalibacter krulwichiae]ARK29817.1 2-acyl-glycerophospho-ethanolamine acyltransferase [Halalkalibacter krulwichiae]
MSKEIKQKESIWRNSIFMKLFASYTVSMFGHWFDMVAIIVLFSYVWETEPIVLALIPVAYALPQVLLGQFASMLTDRFHKVKVMLVADVATAVLTFLLVFTKGPWIALVLIALRSTISVVHLPAQQGLIKRVVKEKLLMKAVTLNGSVNQLAKMIGPLIGASLLTIFSPKLCMIVNAICYTISAFILFKVLLDKKDNEKTSTPVVVNKIRLGFWGTWKTGWLIVFQKKTLYYSLMATFIGVTAIQMVDIQFPVLFREIAPHLPHLPGWLMAASGAGALTMIMLLNHFRKLTNYGWLIGISLFFIGAGFAGVALLKEGFHIFFPLLFGFIVGLGVGLLTITNQYIVQSETTEQEIGRVTAITNSVISFTVILSPLAGGVLVQYFGVRFVYLGSGSLLLLIGMLLFVGDSILFKNNQNRKKVVIAEGKSSS